MRDTAEERMSGVEIDLQELLLFFLRKWLVIVLCLLIGASAAMGFTWKFVTPMYQAEITIYVNNRRTENKEYLSNADLYAAKSLVNTYISIVKSDRVLDKVAESLTGQFTTDELYASIRAVQLNDTEIFCVKVLRDNPEDAALIANAVADVAPYEISDLIEGTSARVIDTAKVPTGRFSPSYSLVTVTGGLIGLVVAIVFLTVYYLTDTRIKDENDLTGLFNLPILGRIPDFGYTSSGNSYGYAKKGYGYSQGDTNDTEKEKEEGTEV